MALIDLEPQSRGTRKSGRLGGLLLFVILAGGAAGVGYWFGRRGPTPAPPPPEAAPQATIPAVAVAAAVSLPSP